MKPNDIIMVDVVSSNQNTRQQRPVLYRFNGAGEQVTDSGEKIAGVGLEGVWPISGKQLPEFPAAEYKRLMGEKKKAEADQLVASYQKELIAAQKKGGSETEESLIVDRVMAFLKQQEHIEEEDGSHFVLHRRDLQVTRIPLEDGRTLFKLTGAAVFGR